MNKIQIKIDDLETYQADLEKTLPRNVKHGIEDWVRFLTRRRHGRFAWTEEMVRGLRDPGTRGGWPEAMYTQVRILLARHRALLTLD